MNYRAIVSDKRPNIPLICRTHSPMDYECLESRLVSL